MKGEGNLPFSYLKWSLFKFVAVLFNFLGYEKGCSAHKVVCESGTFFL